MKEKAKRNPYMIVIISLLALIECCSLFLMYKSSLNKPVKLDNITVSEEKEEATFAIMLEQNIGMKDYLKSSENVWPQEGYTYNKEKSGCVDKQGMDIPNALFYDEINDLATLETEESSFCYLYFDKQ